MKKDAIITILSLLLAVCLWQLTRRSKPEEIREKSSVVPIVVYKDRDSVTHAQKAVSPAGDLGQSVTKNYHTYVIDTLAPALKIATEKINQLTRINAKLEGELLASKIEITKQKTERVYYENKYLSVVTETDTLGHPKNMSYSYNAEINVVHFSKRKNFFSKELHYVDVSSPDKNFKVNGLEHYQKQLVLRPKVVGIGFQAGYGFTQDLRWSPYIGIGASYNFIRF